MAEAEPFAIGSPVLGEPIGGYLVEPDETPVAVAYLLHGRGGSADDWVAALEGRELPPVVLVLPDAPWSDRASWYVDSQGPGGRPVESALVHDLGAAIDARYPELAARRRQIVGGVSMGGAGALRLALRYPERFGRLIALSPAIYPPPPPEGSTLRQSGAFGAGDELFDPSIYEALHYRTLLDAAPGLQAYVAVGETGDLGLEAGTVSADLVRAGARVAMHWYPGGHGFETWTPALLDALCALVTR